MSDFNPTEFKQNYSVPPIVKEVVVSKCECGCEFIEVDYWEDEKSFCFTQFKYLPIRFSMRRRLKFLFTGEISFNEIILDPHGAKCIANYILKHIPNEQDTEKKQ